MLKTSGLLQPDDRQDELKQVEVYKSHSKFMKTKVERLLHDRTWCMFVSKASRLGLHIHILHVGQLHFDYDFLCVG